MAVYKEKIVVDAITKKGFIKINQGTKHIHYILQDESGQDTGIKTHFSKNGQEIGDSLLGLMAREMKISKNQLSKYIECSISREEYYKILRRKGII